MHTLAADLILIVHFAFVLFVIGGLALIWIGYAAGWPAVRNFRFRVLHLAAMVFVAGEALLGVMCPLTSLEDVLRGAQQEKNFIAGKKCFVIAAVCFRVAAAGLGIAGATVRNIHRVVMAAATALMAAVLLASLPAAVDARYAMPPGLEDLSFDSDGGLWTLSEAGSRRWLGWPTFFPLVIRIDPSKLQ